MPMLMINIVHYKSYFKIYKCQIVLILIGPSNIECIMTLDFYTSILAVQ